MNFGFRIAPACPAVIVAGRDFGLLTFKFAIRNSQFAIPCYKLGRDR
jgi:hypothetical protein